MATAQIREFGYAGPTGKWKSRTSGFDRPRRHCSDDELPREDEDIDDIFGTVANETDFSENIRDLEVDRIEKKFIRLRDEWKRQRGHEPSTMKVVLLPAYQSIIGMGIDAVPFLLREA